MSGQSPPSITAIVLTRDEEGHIARCIERLKPVVARVVVIDSHSTDRTVEIARALGADVLQNRWKNYADQFQWGLDNAGVDTDWVLRIDCDEYLEPALIEEIRERLPALPATIGAIDMRRKVVFRDRWIRWGGYYNTVLTRLWRRGYGHIEQRWMDEHIVIERGETLRFSRGDLVDHNLKDIGWWVEKHNGYATRQMIDYINMEHGLFESDERMRRDPNTGARWKRFLRNGVYARSPLYLRALLYFLQRYLLRLGFLDGKQGFVFHFMQGFWYFMLIDAKLDEARTMIGEHGVENFKRHLAERHGVADPVPVRRS